MSEHQTAPTPAITLHLAGCHNRPRPTAETSYVAQAGWREYEERGEPVRVPVLVRIKHAMSTSCQYDKSATDSACGGCVHGAHLRMAAT